MQNEIVSAKQLLILQVDVWNSIGGNVIKRKTNITSIPDSSITIGSCAYKLMFAVSLLPSTRPSWHYTAILSISGRKWLHFNDLSASVAPWPRGGKDVLILFYHIKDTIASMTATSAKVSGTKDTGHRTTAPSRTIFARTYKIKTTTSVSTTATTTTTGTTATCTATSEPNMAQQHHR